MHRIFATANSLVCNHKKSEWMPQGNEIGKSGFKAGMCRFAIAAGELAQQIPCQVSKDVKSSAMNLTI